MLSSAAGLMKIRAQVERDSGVSMKLFGFIAESAFTFIPESCSDSSWNSVRNHPGIAFTFARIPHPVSRLAASVLRRPVFRSRSFGHHIAVVRRIAAGCRRLIRSQRKDQEERTWTRNGKVGHKLGTVKSTQIRKLLKTW